MGHNVGKAADNAVKKGEKVKLADRTPEQIIKDVRRNLAAGLSVTPDDQRFLLAQYDDLVIFQNVAVANDILKTAQIEELERKIAAQASSGECGSLTVSPNNDGLPF